MAFFFSTRRSSLLEMNQRLRRRVLKTPLFTTFLRNRFIKESDDSLGRKTTTGMCTLTSNPAWNKKTASWMRAVKMTSLTRFWGDPEFVANHLAVSHLANTRKTTSLLYRNS
jgi:hypothetical protein